MEPKKISILFSSLAISISSFSQFSVGPEMGLSTGRTHEKSLVLGGSVKYEATMKNKLGWTCAIGYLYFTDKSHDGHPLRTKMVPITGGIKYYFSKPNKGLYLAADLGVNLMTMTTFYPPPSPLDFINTNIRTGFSTGIGYRTNRWDVTAKYNLFAWVIDERYDRYINANYISLRASYFFGKKWPFGKLKIFKTGYPKQKSLLTNDKSIINNR